LPSDVAQWLNDEGVPVPSQSVGNEHTRTADEVKRQWNRTSIVRIAQDKTYLGYVINGKAKKLSYKSKKVMSVPKEDYIEIPNMHQALTDQETFNTVQELIESRTHTRVNKHDFKLKGLVECAECGKKLSVLTQKRPSGKEVQYLRCNTYASNTRLKLCTPHSCNLEKVTNEVIDTIRNRLKEYLKEEKLLAIAKDIKDKTAYKKNIIQVQIKNLENKITQINKRIDNLYEDKLNDLLSVEDFQRMYVSSLEKKEEIQKNIYRLEELKNETSHEVDLKKIIKSFMRMKDIPREMLVSLVDKITITQDKQIKIYYKFSILNENSNIDKVVKLNQKTA
jgi:recombinase